MIKKRQTLQRALVGESVVSLANHPTADDVYEKAIKQHPSISKATVYRNLNSLADDGDILRINIPNAPDRFDHNTYAHYHIRCKRCGLFSDIDIPVLQDIDMEILSSTGFVVQEHDVVFSGICPECIKSQ